MAERVALVVASSKDLALPPDAPPLKALVPTSIWLGLLDEKDADAVVDQTFPALDGGSIAICCASAAAAVTRSTSSSSAST